MIQEHEFEKDVPLYFLRTLCRNTGVRLTPRVSFQVSTRPKLTTCSVCLLPTTPKDRICRNRRVWHDYCYERLNRNNPALVSHIRAYPDEGSYVDTSGVAAPRGRVIYGGDSSRVIRGNLGDNQYRYWIGSKITNAQFGICRGCRKYVQNSQQILNHKEWRGDRTGLPCMFLLTHTYRAIRETGLCMMCNAQTKGERFGVPICSAACEMNWKFGQEQIPKLAEALEETRKEIEHKKDKFRANT